MNKRTTNSIMTLLTVTFLAVPLLASAHGPQTKKGEKLPKTFVCIHCGIKMTVKKTADWKKNCWVCKCNKPTVKCLPAAKK